MVLYYAVIVYR